MPKVFDPFAGGGAIPLEAARLGCNSYGNDINPVAHIIQKGCCEFPQKFGKPITYTKEEFIKVYGEKEFEKHRGDGNVFGDNVNIPNRLTHDVQYYANKLLSNVENEIGQYYPMDKNGNKPIAYYWARVGKCANPSCGAEVPMLKGFYLCKKSGKSIYLKPKIEGIDIEFDIEFGNINREGWNYRGNLKCPCCEQVTDVKLIKEQSKSRGLGVRLLATIFDGLNGKEYRKPTQEEINIVSKIPITIENFRPIESMQRNSAGGDTFSWGINKWGQMFSNRQLLIMQTFVEQLDDIKNNLDLNKNEYSIAIITYLGMFINRCSTRLTSFGVWNPKYEKVQPIFSRQAIPIVFDYPEAAFNLESGYISTQIKWILKVIDSESINSYSANVFNASSGEKSQFNKGGIDVVVTDPPYYDAIAYADLSDFFYIWLKRTIFDIYPLNFATPQTPKSEECTALKHHHENSADKAFKHFENKLLEIFDAIEYQTEDLVSIMFAHQSTKAWTTLCNSILNARMNLVSSWANDSDMTGALKVGKAFLA